MKLSFRMVAAFGLGLLIAASLAEAAVTPPTHMAKASLTIFKTTAAPDSSGTVHVNIEQVCAQEAQIPVYDIRGMDPSKVNFSSNDGFSCATEMGNTKIDLLTTCSVLIYDANGQSGKTTSVKEFSCHSNVETGPMQVQDACEVHSNFSTEDLNLMSGNIYYDTTALRTGPFALEQFSTTVKIQDEK
jgi:hypothetical protein